MSRVIGGIYIDDYFLTTFQGSDRAILQCRYQLTILELSLLVAHISAEIDNALIISVNRNYASYAHFKYTVLIVLADFDTLALVVLFTS
jgi:hypothetical protein